MNIFDKWEIYLKTTPSRRQEIDNKSEKIITNLENEFLGDRLRVGSTNSPTITSPPRHDPKLVRRALKKLGRVGPSKQKSTWWSIQAMAMTIALLALGLNLCKLDRIHLWVYVSLLAMFAPIALWIGRKIYTPPIVEAAKNMWFVADDGTVIPQVTTFYDESEYRHLILVDATTRLKLPTGDSLLNFKDPPTTESVQQVIDFLVSLEAEKDASAKARLIESHTRIRVDAGDPYRDERDSLPFEIVPAAEGRQHL